MVLNRTTILQCGADLFAKTVGMLNEMMALSKAQCMLSWSRAHREQTSQRA